MSTPDDDGARLHECVRHVDDTEFPAAIPGEEDRDAVGFTLRDVDRDRAEAARRQMRGIRAIDRLRRARRGRVVAGGRGGSCCVGGVRQRCDQHEHGSRRAPVSWAHRANNSFMPPAISTDTSTSTRGRARPAARHEVARLPGRVELGLVAAQALEVIKMLAVAEDEIAHAVPRRRERVRFQPRQRRHAEIEPAAALAPAPQHEFDEQIVHGTAGRVRIKAHEVHRQLRPGAGSPEVGERHRLSGRAHQRHRELPHIGRRERPDGEALLAGGLAREPGVRDLPEQRHQCLQLPGRHHLKVRAVALRAPVRLAQVRARCTLEREFRKRHARFLADLHAPPVPESTYSPR